METSPGWVGWFDLRYGTWIVLEHAKGTKTMNSRGTAMVALLNGKYGAEEVVFGCEPCCCCCSLNQFWSLLVTYKPLSYHSKVKKPHCHSARTNTAAPPRCRQLGLWKIYHHFHPQPVTYTTCWKRSEGHYRIVWHGGYNGALGCQQLVEISMKSSLIVVVGGGDITVLL